jgi:hypothetical protein
MWFRKLSHVPRSVSVAAAARLTPNESPTIPKKSPKARTSARSIIRIEING